MRRRFEEEVRIYAKAVASRCQNQTEMMVRLVSIESGLAIEELLLPLILQSESYTSNSPLSSQTQHLSSFRAS